MATKHSLLREVVLLSEATTEQAGIFKEVQRQLRKQLDIDASLATVMSLFMPIRNEPSDKQTVVAELKQHGYVPGGSWLDNHKFWEGIVSKPHYDKICTLKSCDTNEGQTTFDQPVVVEKYLPFISEQATLPIVSAIKRAIGDVATSDSVEFEAQSHADRMLRTFEGSDLDRLEAEIYIIESIVESYYSGGEDEEDYMYDSECWEEEEAALTQDDYDLWLQHTLSVAEERGLNPNRKYDFMDVLLDDILDNDPRLDEVGANDEASKTNIAKLVWKHYQLQQAKDKTASRAKAQKTARQQRGTDAEENEEQSGYGTMQTVIQQASTAASRDAALDFGTARNVTKNPYTPGTLRYKMWNDAYHAASAQHSPHSTEEEEVGGVDHGNLVAQRIHREGFKSAVRAFNDAIRGDGDVSDEQVACPHPEGTSACSAWKRGYQDALERIVKRSARDIGR